MSATTQARHIGPRMLASIFVALFAALIVEVGIIVWVYEQGRTQHQICQLVGFVGDQTQHGIDTNSKLVMKDARIGTPDAKADAVIRRASILQSTTFLIRVNRIHC